MASTLAELVWLLGMLQEVSFKVEYPITIFTNSKVAMQIVANPVFHERTKHIEIDCHFIMEKIQQGIVKTEYIHTKD